jgi:Kef-type K+ transport system membrane component KefB
MLPLISAPPLVNDFNLGLVIFSLILLAGLIGSDLVKKTLILPGISGYIIIGLLIGPGATGLISKSLLTKMDVYIDICFGLILFELGKNFNLGWRKTDPWLFLGGILATVLPFICVLSSLILLDFKLNNSLLIAAITITSSPAIVFLIAKELNVDGTLVRKSKGLIAINNVLGILIFIGILPFIHYKNEAALSKAIMQPLYVLIGSITLSFIIYLSTLIFAKLLSKDQMRQFIMLVAFLTLNIAICYILNLSPVISLLFYGIFIRNFNYKSLIMNIDFGYVEDLLFLLLLVITAANLNFNKFDEYIVTVLIILAVRFIGLLLPLYFLAQKSGFTKQQSFYLSCSIVPIAAMALWISKTLELTYPSIGGQVKQIVILSVLVMQLFGPIITKWAFKKAEQAQ